MRIEDIAANTDIACLTSINEAKILLAEVSDYELHFYLVQKETINATTPATRKKITLAQMEYERRNSESSKQTTFKANIISACIGVVGVIIGVILGAFLKPDTLVVKFTPSSVEQEIKAQPQE